MASQLERWTCISGPSLLVPVWYSYGKGIRGQALLSPTWKPSTRGLRYVWPRTVRDPDPAQRSPRPSTRFRLSRGPHIQVVSRTRAEVRNRASQVIAIPIWDANSSMISRPVTAKDAIPAPNSSAVAYSRTGHHTSPPATQMMLNLQDSEHGYTRPTGMLPHLPPPTSPHI